MLSYYLIVNGFKGFPAIFLFLLFGNKGKINMKNPIFNGETIGTNHKYNELVNIGASVIIIFSGKRKKQVVMNGFKGFPTILIFVKLNC